jgi:hypothetical protein
MAQITLTSQMGSRHRTESLCLICEISVISVRFWTRRDAWPLYRDDSRFLDSRRSLGMTLPLYDVASGLQMPRR